MHCRTLTKELGKTLFRVLDKKKRTLGLRCPAEVLKQVGANDRLTASARAAAVQKRDQAVLDKAREALFRLYPKIPAECAGQVLSHAFEKRSGRVGRATTKTLDGKIISAVVAHVRHRQTGYDALLRRGIGRERARARVLKCMNGILRAWGGDAIRGARV